MDGFSSGDKATLPQKQHLQQEVQNIWKVSLLVSRLLLLLFFFKPIQLGNITLRLYRHPMASDLEREKIRVRS